MKNFMIITLLCLSMLFTGASNSGATDAIDYGNVGYGGVYHDGGLGFTIGFGQRITKIGFGEVWLMESGHSSDTSVGGAAITVFAIKASLIGEAPILDKITLGIFGGAGGDAFNSGTDSIRTIAYIFLKRGGLISFDVSDHLGFTAFWNKKSSPKTDNEYQSSTTKGFYGFVRF